MIKELTKNRNKLNVSFPEVSIAIHSSLFLNTDIVCLPLNNLV